MGLFDKVKNLFTEEVEEEVKPIKKESRHIDVTPVTRVERETKEEIKKEEEPRYEEEKKEEKFVFFSDDDFKDLEKPKREEKKEPVINDRVLPYRGAPIKPNVVEEKKPFKASLIISPVYGVLDKNYTKDEVVSKKVVSSRTYNNKSLSIDDIRNKAYGTIEDEIKDSLLGNFSTESEKEPIENDIDIFEELEKYNELDKLEDSINDTKDNDIDGIFDELDNKKDQILDELDNKKDEILDELTTKKSDIIVNDEEIDNLDLDDETLELSRQLESQKRKLDEINDFIDDTKDDSEDELEINEDELRVHSDDDLNESELFDLIDSMYEKKDDE